MLLKLFNQSHLYSMNMHRLLLFGLLTVLSCSGVDNPFRDFSAESELHFVIIIPSYNNARWYKKNIDSVLEQTYPHYRVIYIDDCSKDKTGDLVETYIATCGQQERCTIIKNHERKGPLANRYNAIHQCQPDEICVMLDGDDYLAHPYVLERLHTLYTNPHIWMTYGQYVRWCSHCIEVPAPAYVQSTPACNHLSGLGWCRELPPTHIIDQNLWREHITYIMQEKGGWVLGALLSFYAGLFHRIDKKDLCYKEKFFGRGSDMAAIIPLAELAGHHITFIPEILYVYNREASILEDDGWEQRTMVTYSMHHQRRYSPYIPES